MPTGLLTNPTSKVVRQLLIDGSLGQSGGSVSGTGGNSPDWPIFSPNTPDLPDNVVVVKDTSGIQQGRLQNDGSEVYRPGIQVLVRSNDYDIGWEKTHRVAIHLDESVLRSSAVVDSVSYFIGSWSRASGPIPIGKESEGRRLETSAGTSKRYLFTLNGTLSLSLDSGVDLVPAWRVHTVDEDIVASTNQSQGQQPVAAEIVEVVTVANDDNVITLPTASAGRTVKVINSGAQRLQVFPALGDAIDGQLVNVSSTIAPDTSDTFCAVDEIDWYT